VDLSTDGPLPLLSELSHLTRFFSSETVVGILGAVFILFRVTASEAAVFSAAWLAVAGGMEAVVVVGAGDVEDVMTPVAVAVAAAVVVLPVAASVGAAVLAFAVVTDFASVATTVVAVATTAVAVATTVVVVATTVVAVAAGVAVAGAGAVGSEEGVPVTVAVSSSRLSTPALFRYACNM
jgi:hypothetical protein